MPYRINGIGTALYAKDFLYVDNNGVHFDCTKYFSILFVPIVAIEDLHVFDYDPETSTFRCFRIKPYSNRRSRMYCWFFAALIGVISMAVSPYLLIFLTGPLAMYLKLKAEYEREEKIQSLIRKYTYSIVGIWTDPATWEKPFILDLMKNWSYGRRLIDKFEVGDFRMWNFIARTFYELGDYKLACFLSRVAFGLEKNPDSLLILRDIFYKLGKLDEVAYIEDLIDAEFPAYFDEEEEEEEWREEVYRDAYRKFYGEEEYSDDDEEELEDEEDGEEFDDEEEEVFEEDEEPVFEGFANTKNEKELEARAALLFKVLRSDYHPDRVQDLAMKQAYTELFKRITDDYNNLTPQEFISRYSGSNFKLPTIICDLADQAFSSKELERAQIFYKKVLELDPSNIKAVNNLAVIYGMQNEHQQALLLLRKALRIEPNNKKLLWNYALTLIKMNKQEEAIRTLKKLRLVEDNFEKLKKIDQYLKELETAN